MARRVLLAWEQGAGFGHTTQLARLGVRLRQEGVEPMAAVRYPQLSAPLVAAGIRVIQAPPWPAPRPRDDDRMPASATLTDTLALLGLRDPLSVSAVLRGWRSILDTEQPDLMVADYAPLAGVAARGRCAIMQAGTPYCLPPQDLEAMPLQHSFAPPRHSDTDVLAAVNTALDETGLPPLPRIGALFAGNDHFVRSFPLIDPYADLRPHQAEGPILAALPQPRRDDARGIFCYMHLEGAGRPDVTQMLLDLAPQLEIYVPGAPKPWRAALQRAGARVHEAPVPIAPALARCRLVLHQGSAGIAADALLAGVPQFTFSIHVEHYLNGEALAAAGVGRNVPLFWSRAQVDASHVRALLDDEDARMLADAAGLMHRAAIKTDPLEVLAARCLALLDG